MKESEEELQNQIESGRRVDGPDAHAYRHVFHALGKVPDFQLPADFAEKVASRLSATEEKRFSVEYVWFAAGIFLLATAFLVTIWFTGFRLDFGFLNVMAGYKGLAVFAVTFILLLNWLDKKLVIDKQPHRKF